MLPPSDHDPEEATRRLGIVDHRSYPVKRSSVLPRDSVGEVGCDGDDAAGVATAGVDIGDQRRACCTGDAERQQQQPRRTYPCDVRRRHPVVTAKPASASRSPSVEKVGYLWSPLADDKHPR